MNNRTTRRQRIGGRESQFTLDDLVRHGVNIGLADLSIQAVANALNVTPAAVYRRVKSRFELETLVGEAILARLIIQDNPAHDASQHLVSFGLQLRAFCLANPGTAHYIQQDFPRGPSGLALFVAQIEALTKRGYDIQGSIVVAASIASITVGQVIGQESQSKRLQETESLMLDMAQLPPPYAAISAAEATLPRVTHGQYFELLLTAVADGLVTNLPVGTDTVSLLQERIHHLKGIN